MSLRTPSGDYHKVGGSKRFARDFKKLNREVARQSEVSLGLPGTNGVDGITMGADPERLVVKITATDSGTPPAYSWTPQIEVDGAWTDDDSGFTGGTASVFPAYELGGNEDVPVDGSAIVELRPGHGGEYLWFFWPPDVAGGGGGSSTITITDGSTSQSVASGDTITFTANGEGIDLSVTATDTVTADLDFNGLSTATYDPYTDYIAFYDATDSTHKKALDYTIYAYGASDSTVAVGSPSFTGAMQMQGSDRSQTGDFSLINESGGTFDGFTKAASGTKVAKIHYACTVQDDGTAGTASSYIELNGSSLTGGAGTCSISLGASEYGILSSFAVIDLAYNDAIIIRVNGGLTIQAGAVLHITEQV